MALTYITQHDENIYDHAKIKVTAVVKHPKFEGKHREFIKPIKPDTERIERNTLILTSTNKYLHKTMGYAETPLHAPNDYLKKDGGLKWIKKIDHKCIRKGLQNLPIVDLCAKFPEREIKDFKMKNIKDNVCRKPKRPPPKFAINRTGDVQSLCNSGLLPAYIFHPNYGKVPAYLQAAKKLREEEKMLKEVARKEQPTGIRLITPEERDELLTGLKKNWNEMQKAFQILPVLTDTLPKQKRKNDLDKELSKLENDILLVESNPLIYVCENDDEDFIPRRFEKVSKRRQVSMDVTCL